MIEILLQYIKNILPMLSLILFVIWFGVECGLSIAGNYFLQFVDDNINMLKAIYDFEKIRITIFFIFFLPIIVILFLSKNILITIFPICMITSFLRTINQLMDIKDDIDEMSFEKNDE